MAPLCASYRIPPLSSWPLSDPLTRHELPRDAPIWSSEPHVAAESLDRLMVGKLATKVTTDQVAPSSRETRVAIRLAEELPPSRASANATSPEGVCTTAGAR
eukprot:scaffold12086_cov67-Phaeocystis_antarctica.AAC.16